MILAKVNDVSSEFYKHITSIVTNHRSIENMVADYNRTIDKKYVSTDGLAYYKRVIADVALPYYFYHRMGAFEIETTCVYDYGMLSGNKKFLLECYDLSLEMNDFSHFAILLAYIDTRELFSSSESLLKRFFEAKTPENTFLMQDISILENIRGTSTMIDGVLKTLFHENKNVTTNPFNIYHEVLDENAFVIGKNLYILMTECGENPVTENHIYMAATAALMDFEDYYELENVYLYYIRHGSLFGMSIGKTFHDIKKQRLNFKNRFYKKLSNMVG